MAAAATTLSTGERAIVAVDVKTSRGTIRETHALVTMITLLVRIVSEDATKTRTDLKACLGLDIG
jgi:hypothetical protein